LFAELTSSHIVQLEQIKYGKFDGLGVVLDHSSAIESGWEVSFGHQCSNAKLMKMGIYSNLPLTPCTANKLKEVDLRLT
jgi:hypothetical protein